MIRTPSRKQLREALERMEISAEQVERVMAEGRLIDVFGRPAIHVPPPADGRHARHSVATLSSDTAGKRWSVGAINRLDTIDPNAPVLQFRAR